MNWYKTAQQKLQSFWIAPNGKNYPVLWGSHTGWALAHGKMLKEKYDIDFITM